MPQPIDYSIPAPPNLAGQFVQGLQGGFAVQQMQNQRAEQELARIKQEQALQQQQQMNSDISLAVKDPRQIPSLMIKYPQYAEKWKQGADAMSADRRRAAVTHLTEVASAIQSGAPEVAQDMMKEHAKALRNSGDEEGAKATETMAQVAKDHPDFFFANTVSRLYGLDNEGKTAADGLLKVREAPAELKKKEADASAAESGAATAKVTAKFAESKAVSDLKLTDANIAHLAADTEIARQNSRIAAMNAGLNKEKNDLERQSLKLKLDEAVQKRDETARGKVAEVRQGAATLDSLLNTIEQVKKHKALNSVVGPLAGKEMYPHTTIGMTTPGMLGVIPDADERADAITLIEQLQSQATLGQLQALKSASNNGSSGFGALSQKELEVIQNGIQSLKRTQSPESFRSKLDEMARLMKKNRDILANKYGLDAGAPDTPAAPGARPPLSSFGGG